jgi:UDP-N-acetylglucosamine--N-acetylmuramyl-(pentapeptide) pyrophosphoryl-undecaprenol N-acetylglucosamine transferase
MNVLVAGGGTGGHIFPAIALAEAFMRHDPQTGILFVGTRNRLEVSTLKRKGLRHMSIAAAGLKGRSLWQQFQALLRLPKGFFQALRIIWRFKPDLVIGVGGYASGPVALAAKVMRKKVVIHEQNVIPGFTNRLLGRVSDRVFVSFADTPGFFDRAKTVLTGNPVRREILEARRGGGDGDLLNILVVGGSQGAHAINRAIIEALDYLAEPEKIAFTHQTGANDFDWVESAYTRRKIVAHVQPFFEDMAAAYQNADLVICRAGATTVAELTALGKPAIYIPFPFAVHNHQELNARRVTDVAGGEILLERDLHGAALANRIDKYLSRPADLGAMSVRAKALGKPEAADHIVSECKRLVVIGR